MKSLSPILLALGLLSCGSAIANPDLMRAKNCIACHTTSTKIVGPAFKDIAARYAGQKDAEERLSQKIVKGGSGSWGAVPMPPNGQVSPAEAMTLAKWILTLK